MSNITMMGVSFAQNASGPTGFFEAQFQSSGSGEIDFAAVFEDKNDKMGGVMCGICNTGSASGSAAGSTSSSSGSGSASASSNPPVDFSSFFAALFNMVDGKGGSATGSGGSGDDPLVDMLLGIGSGSGASTDATSASSTSSGDGSSNYAIVTPSSGSGSSSGASDATGSNMMAQMFSDMQKMFQSFETAATQVSQTQTAV